jgi:dihydroorotase/N-acyl-D-amino-acid deacylase
MLFLANGLLFDGTNRPGAPGSLLIEGDRIAAAGAISAPTDCPRFDCAGLAVAPGFIDLHSHSDLQVLENRPEKVIQGVTTEAVGNCGFSPFPYTGDPGVLREFGAGILGRPDGWGWSSAAGYLDAVEKQSTRVGVASLAGHGSLRVAVTGLRQAPPAAAELDRMAGLLEESLDAGCAGFSTGLMYAPGSSAGPEELERLCSVVARKQKLYATHMRSYAAGLIAAVREQLDLARATGCRLQISHLQAAGRTNWDRQQQAVDEIEAARAQGIDVEFDIYPYQCGSTVLTQFLPQWALDGGATAMMARLDDAAERRRMLAEMTQERSPLWRDITISAVQSAANAPLVGKTIAEIAAARQRDPAETALDLVGEERGAINIISFNQSESNLKQLLTHPLCSVISDGFYVSGKPHPRLHGTFPELLGSVVRDRGWMSLAEALHKITAKPAARLGLRDRGCLEPGCQADVTVFDPAAIQSRATYESPAHDPVGVVKVIRAGKIVHG